jgi:hypothetical protein
MELDTQKLLLLPFAGSHYASIRLFFSRRRIFLGKVEGIFTVSRLKTR